MDKDPFKVSDADTMLEYLKDKNYKEQVVNNV